ncbi:NuoM family protein [Chitinophaga sp. S165]|uniref:complex I subunit 4 family protein n=1 Tax=Chitinophaga sp. S165 TaxID=2135462 RepID=UPI000D7192F2|nr:NADH-quinone oxidoreductase subunit M [Chitinophaga sp. S165]PWV46570.1 NADH dehydrogenase subunit M [Chitinophaga sp. S165]
MILIWMICILLAGGILCWLTAQKSAVLAKWIALLTVTADLLIACWLFRIYQAFPDNTSWFINYQTDWIPALGISFHVAMDGFSHVLLLLTFFLGILAVLCSWKEIREKTGFYFFNLLWTLAGISGVFIAMDMILFYFCWEVMLIPMYFLITIWGDARRRYAGFKFFIFTQVGSLLMLLSLLALYFIHGDQTGTYTFDYFSLLRTSTGSPVMMWIMLGFLIAFAIKLPVVPFHNWLPDAHGEAPTAGSLVLAGLLLKTGAYGIIRFVLPLFPESAAAIGPWMILLGVIGIIYGALLAFSQTDLKRLIAYTSVSHMGFVLVGIFSFSNIAMQGVVMQILTHGLSTGALFVMAGMLKERLHTRDITKMGGLWTAMPAMGGIAILFTMASAGLPALGNFIAEFFILLGTFTSHPTFSIIATLGLILSAVYSLRMMQKVFMGQQTATEPIRDISARELVIMAALSISIVALGLFPQPVIDTVQHLSTIHPLLHE